MSIVDQGAYSQVRAVSGALVEYTNAQNRLSLKFQFNPSTITRSRSIEIRTGEGQDDGGGYDFHDKESAPAAAQGVTVKPESFSVKILLDATERMAAAGRAADGKKEKSKEQEGSGTPESDMMLSPNKPGWEGHLGVQPELDILRSMVEPKLQAAEGVTTLAALGQGGGRASSKKPFASVLIFIWGEQALPVFITQVQIESKAFLPSLVPYRAEASLTFQIIESDNPYYNSELKRQFASAIRASFAEPVSVPEAGG